MSPELCFLVYAPGVSSAAELQTLMWTIMILLLEKDSRQLREHHGTDYFQEKYPEFRDTTV